MTDEAATALTAAINRLAAAIERESGMNGGGGFALTPHPTWQPAAVSAVSIPSPNLNTSATAQQISPAAAPATSITPAHTRHGYPGENAK
jgi:hypothetical protein